MKRSLMLSYFNPVDFAPNKARFHFFLRSGRIAPASNETPRSTYCSVMRGAALNFVAVSTHWAVVPLRLKMVRQVQRIWTPGAP